MVRSGGWQGADHRAFIQMGRGEGGRGGAFFLFSSKFICFSVAPFIVSFGILSCVCPEVVGAQKSETEDEERVIKMWHPSARHGHRRDLGGGDSVSGCNVQDVGGAGRMSAVQTGCQGCRQGFGGGDGMSGAQTGCRGHSQGVKGHRLGVGGIN